MYIRLAVNFWPWPKIYREVFRSFVVSLRFTTSLIYYNSKRLDDETISKPSREIIDIEREIVLSLSTRLMIGDYLKDKSLNKCKE